MAARLQRLRTHVYSVYLHGAGTWILGKTLQNSVQRLEDRLLRSVGGVSRHASETHVDFLRRGSTAVKLLKRAEAYRSLWTVVCRTVLTRAGRLARSNPDQCAALAALSWRDARWDGPNEALRHRRLRRPAQSWPAQYERSVVRLLGTDWMTLAQDEKAFATRVKALVF